MLDQMANHASYVRRFIDEIGHDTVEAFLDVCLSIENLIDITSPFKSAPGDHSFVDEFGRTPPVPKLKSKTYMDKYINPSDFVQAQQKKLDEKAERVRKFPDSPERDVLKFLVENAPLAGWQKKILQIVRDESYYFSPQGQTKIMNEGWATYWHSKMMTELAPLDGSEIVDYCDHYAGVVASQPGQLNPYKLGVELFRHIERRWDKGQFGIDWIHCDDPKKRQEWDLKSGLGRKKIFEVRAIHNDITFIDEYLDEDFCHTHKMFIYDFDKRNNRYVISGRDFREVKSRVLQQLTNFGQPIISVVDGNYKNRSELLLKHTHDGIDLKHDFTLETLKNLFKVWTRPVHLETIIENVKRRVSFDGQNHESEKID